MKTDISPPAPKIRPFYRSLVFYFAVLGLVFIIWSWGDSGTHESMLLKNGRWGMFSCIQEYGAVQFSHGIIHVLHIKSFHAHRTKNNIFFYQQFSTVGGFIFPEAITPMESSMGGKGIRIAHWLIVLVYIFTWSFIIAGWQRYRSKFASKMGLVKLLRPKYSF
jgi:hypothetical protein